MKIRVGVVGVGIYGAVLVDAFHSAHRLGKIDFVAVADINQTALDKMKELYGLKGYTNYKAMLDNEALDALAVVTPDYLHREITLEAAKKKIHLLVQKPLATNMEEAHEMVKAAEENNILLFVDFHKRFDLAHIQLKQAVQSGKLGEVEYGHVYVENTICVPTVWFKAWAQHSSPAWFVGIHFFDLLFWILDKAPIRVYATGIKKKLLSMGIDTYDSLSAKFEYENGTSISVDTSWILPSQFTGVNQKIRLTGTHGVHEVDTRNRGIIACYESEPSNLVLNPFGKILGNIPIAGAVPRGYTIESMLYFLDLVTMIKEGKISIKDLEGHYPTGREALISTGMSVALHESAKLGKVIEIKYEPVRFFV